VDGSRQVQPNYPQGSGTRPVTDWFRGYCEIVLDEIKKAAKAEAKQ